MIGLDAADVTIVETIGIGMIGTIGTTTTTDVTGTTTTDVDTDLHMVAGTIRITTTAMKTDITIEKVVRKMEQKKKMEIRRMLMMIKIAIADPAGVDEVATETEIEIGTEEGTGIVTGNEEEIDMMIEIDTDPTIMTDSLEILTEREITITTGTEKEGQRMIDTTLHTTMD